MAYESSKELVLQVINENRELLEPDSPKNINMKFLLSDERTKHLSSDKLLEVISQLIESGEIRCVVKRNPEESNKILNFTVKEVY